jgi:DNA polymerase-1
MTDALYMLDGHAQIYRAYHAIAGLTSPTGEPTSATFGFCGMLLKLFQTRRPSHVLMTLDAGSVVRSAMDETYKAQRKPMPDDMPIQIDRITQIMELVGIPVLRHEGSEADDVIATLVTKIRRDPAHAAFPIYMCTKDKDLDQLIDPYTWMFDIQTGEEMDAAGLRARKGYGPEQAGDVLALTGDTADNIPGVPGVGPKTAAKWIAEYGSLDALIARREELKGKIGQTFRENLAVLENSRRLVALIRDIPVEMDWQASRARPERLGTLAPIFRELGFGRMLQTLEQVVDSYRAAGVAPMSVADSTPGPRTAAAAPLKKAKPAEEMPEGGLFDQMADGAAGAGPAGGEGATHAMTEPPSEPGSVPEAAAEANEPAAPVEGSGTPVGLAPVVGDYRLIDTPEKLVTLVAELRAQVALKHSAGGGGAGPSEEKKEPHAPWPRHAAVPGLAVDTETDALGAMCSNLCGISLCATVGQAFYVPVKGLGQCLDPDVVQRVLGPLLADPTVPKIGQNIKYDLNSLRVFGIDVRGVFLDTMVASYVLDSSRLSHGMDALAADLLGLKKIPTTDLIGKASKQISFAEVPLERTCQYASEDADVTLRLAETLYPRLLAQKLDRLCLNVEMPLVQVLADMEFNGVAVDRELLVSMSKQIGEKLIALGVQIRQAAGVDFNHDSPRQLADVLFNKLGLPVIKMTKTGPSTDIDVLEELSPKHPVPALIVEYRQLTRLKTTYLDALGRQINPRTGRVHASFNQSVAATGRLSSSDPNLQNIPIRTEIGRQIRRAFVPGDADHLLLTADYSQIELRVLAHFCQDPALLGAFAAGKDVHRVVAAEIFGVPEEQVTSEQRSIAKTVNFGIIYGQTGFGLSKVLRIPQDQASDFINAYRKRFPQIDRFSQVCIKQASLHGYVETILGRRRAIPDINSPIQSRRQFGQRAALNSVIQGSAADLIKLAMLDVYKAFVDQPAEARMLIQIHDELVLEVRKAAIERVAAVVREKMEHAMELRVALKVDINWGPNWLEGK